MCNRIYLCSIQIEKVINNSLKIFLSLYCLLSAISLCAQNDVRTVTSINNNWEFARDPYNNGLSLPGKTLKWEPVNIPHTWNTEDVMDDEPGYYRGTGWYKKKIQVPSSMAAKSCFLYFEGANQVAELYINGKKAGEHIGGYSGFYIPVSSLLIAGKENEILIKVDNRYDPSIPPLTADFTFYGGIYRDLWMVAVDRIHFSFNDFSSRGIYITTPVVAPQKSTVQVRMLLANDGSLSKKLNIRTTVQKLNGTVVTATTASVMLDAKKEHTLTMPLLQVKHPQLWSPDTPYLYSVVSEIKDAATGKLIDRVAEPLGFRWFHFDAAKGFFLNGKSYKLVGTSRHQDFKGFGNAVPDKMAVEDVELLKKMGGNFLRVAHYPQDPAVLRACDSLGILASVEIPLINEITESDSFFNNCSRMLSEMIRQHYNHPSVIIWCSMNEILLKPRYNSDKIRQKQYLATITRLARSLDSLARQEDPSRYTMLAHHGDYNRYRETGLVDIPMILGWNLYSGWYGATLSDFPQFLDNFHKDYPQKPMLVSEYGADADPRIRSMQPSRFDKSVEYTTKFHQYYMSEMFKRPFVAGAMVWNLADFNSETRTESMPHINNKGLLTWDRIPKDPYYYYKAVLTSTPFIKILGTQPAAGIADSSGASCKRPLQVATNLEVLRLFINGKEAADKRMENGLCEWEVALQEGENNITVKGLKNGKQYTDNATIHFKLYPSRFNEKNSFAPMNILLGSNRFFTDDEQQVWVPGLEYKTGGWGYSGGKAFKLQNNSRLPYGSDKNITGTPNDPIYQTQQTGIEKYRLDVPPGEYEIVLHFAELLSSQAKEQPYNLSDADRIEPNGKRVFNVYINDNLVLDHFDIAAQYGTATAVVRSFKVKALGTNGINIEFKAIEGQPVLNALQVKPIHHTGLQQTD